MAGAVDRARRAYALRVLVLAISLGLITGVAVFVVVPPATAETFPTPNTRVDDSLLDTTTDFQPALAASGSSVYLAYSTIFDIKFARSDDGGSSWFGWTLVSDNPGDGSIRAQPDLAVAPNGTAYVVWVENRNSPPCSPGSLHVFASWSADGGLTWGDGLNNNNDVRVDECASPVSSQPTITVNAAGLIAVAWSDTRMGDSDIWASTSIDGSIWAANVRVNDDAGTQAQGSPSLAAAGDAIHIVWNDSRSDIGDIMHARYAGPGWTANARVDDAPAGVLARDPVLLAGLSGNPAILGVAWVDNRAAIGRQDARFSGSADGGLTWGDGLSNNNDVRVNDNAATALAGSPDLVQAGGRLIAAWNDDRLGDQDVFASYSLDLGATWADGIGDTDARVNDDEASVVTAFAQDSVALAAVGTTAVAAWTDGREGNNDVAASFSVDALTWGDGFRNDNDAVAAGLGTVRSGAQQEPQLAVYGGTLYAAWFDDRDDATGPSDDYNIYFTSSADGGTTWGDDLVNNNDVRVDDGPAPAAAGYPDMAVAPSGRICLIYSDNRNGNFDIFVTWSDDGGRHWGDGHINGNDVRVNDDPIGPAVDQVEPALTIDASGALYAVWQDDRNGDMDIYSARSVDGGMIWSANVRVNDDAIGNGVDQLEPSVTREGSSLTVAWADARTGEFDIRFSSSGDGGTTWGDGSSNDNDVRINDDLGAADQRRPAMAARLSGELVVIWEDRRQGGQDIYSSSSLDGGATWGDGIANDNDVRVSDAAAASERARPSIAADASAYAAWHDNRGGGNTDIWFSNRTGSGPWSSPDDRVNNPANQSAIQYAPEVAIDATRVMVVWEDDRLGAGFGARNLWFASAARQQPSSAPLDRILLTPWPGPTVVSVGQNQTYTAVGLNGDGQLNTTWSPAWSTTDGRGTLSGAGGSATMGFTINYTASIPGTDNITVAAAGLPAVTNRSRIDVVDLRPPTVEITPAHGASDVSATTTIVLMFSEPMDPTSTQAVTVTANGQVVTGSWSWSGNNATFTPGGPFPDGAFVTVTVVASQARDIAGNPMAGDASFSFRIAKRPAEPPWTWVLLILAVVVILVALALLLRRRRKGKEVPAEAEVQTETEFREGGTGTQEGEENLMGEDRPEAA